jgi:hypothetical protein
MAFSGMLRRVALVRTDVSEELSASFIRVTRIGELGITLAVTSNRSTIIFVDVFYLFKYRARIANHLHENLHILEPG